MTERETSNETESETVTDDSETPTESDRITQLDDATIRKIAAGEVVERPSSVVKELVENSLDADANRIDVTVEEGGTERIVVSDDGVGMSEADVRAAVREHTTSKIEDIDDLESGVGTLGFRGEALHTIGAVARVTITTKPRGGSDDDEESQRATELRLAGGEVESVGPAGRPEGTTIEVVDLFYNTPARRKYLKTTTTEFSHVNTVVTRYALANPDTAVSLTHGDREVFATPGRGDLQSAMLAVYGREVATSMIEVEGENREDADAAISVSGYVSDPETTRSTREYVSTYVNGRYVRSSVVREAILSAYGGQLSAERYPFAVLSIDVPTDEVDVNVHPRKLEVRWGDEEAVRNAVETAVEEALLDHGLVRSSAPRGRSTPDEARVDPEREGVGGDDERNREDSDSAGQSKLVESEKREQSTLDASADESPNASASADAGRDADAGETVDANGTADAGGAADAVGTADGTTDAGRTVDTEASAPTNASESTGTSENPSTPEGTTTGEATQSRTTTSPTSSSATSSSATSSNKRASSKRTSSKTTSRGTIPSEPANPDRKFSSATETATLSGGTTSDPEFETLPRMQILGQLHDTYVVAETPDGLVLVDQHAADERVNYEQLRAEFADDATTQMLAQPVELELTAGEAAVFEEYREALERLGFRAERAAKDGDERGEDENEQTDRKVVVRTVPTVLDATLDPELLRDALGEFVSTDPGDRGDTVEAVADDLLADLACYPSITGNSSLREGSVVELLGALDDCENPYACPHGRPVIIEFSEEEIDDRFERDYPGHAGRREE